MVAGFRRELEIDVEVVRSRFSGFKVLVDGATVIDGGAWDALSVLPSDRKVLEAVRICLST
jgi:hypothetical protein